VRTWQIIAVATAFYFGSAAPAAADELPLVPTEADAAVAVEAITAEVAPEAAPLVAQVVSQEPAAPAVAAPEPAPTAQPPPEPQQESQYHQPEPQYQPSTTDAAEPLVPAADAIEAPAEEPAAPTAPDPAVSPTAATVEDAAASPKGAPDTWIWNWTWDCDPQSAPPSELPADSSSPNWAWNWNWNCDRGPITGGDTSQYQSAGSQYQPENVNVSIRIGSPGDDGPVTQTIAAAAEAVASTAATIGQSVMDASGPPVPLGLPPPHPPPGLTIPSLPPLVIGPSFTSIGPPQVTLPPISLPVLPPLELSLPPLEVPAAAASIVEAVTEALEAEGVQVAATRSAAPPRPRSVNAREPQHVAVADAGASWRRPIAVTSGRARPEAAHAASGSPVEPGEPLWPHMPRPNAPAIGSAQLSGGANGVLLAFAALLAAFFLYPYLAARPVRVPRDRRRLRPRAGRFDPPG
jgi:hypothetical protein